MKEFILWDNDGVLVDTEYWYFRATQRALEELGVTLDRATYMNNMIQGKASWGMALDAGVHPDAIANKRAQRDEYYRHFLREKDIEISGVLDVLDKLSRKYRMAIVTTSKRADFKVIHDTRDILPFMEFTLVREDYVASKPDPEPYLLGLSRFGAAAEQALVVEDSQRGLQSAVAAGIECAIVHNDFTASHDFTQATCRYPSIVALAEDLL